jgi:hypothetical protein
MYRLLACLLFATSLPAMAQIYEYIDAQGNKAYTNQPPPTGVSTTPVELEPTNGADVPPPSATPPPSPAKQQPAVPQTSNSSADSDDEDVQYDEDYYDNLHRHPGPVGPDAVGADPGRGHIGTPGRR